MDSTAKVLNGGRVRVATALHKCWGGTGKRGGDSTAQVLRGEGEGGW